MELTFLHHSAVAAAFDDTLLVFDYYKFDQGKTMKDGFIGDDDIRRFSRVYVFASHSHHDHYNRRVLDWAKSSENVTYILDDTIRKPKEDVRAVMMMRGDTFEEDGLFVREFGSTDTGGSFYVEYNGTSLFHAGDLNFWHWRDEGDAEYSRQMAIDFDREMKFLRSHVERIDYAFFPVDKRMGSDYDEGADMFIEMMRPKFFVPIHFVDYADTEAFAKKHAGGKTTVITIRNNGQRLV